MEYGPRGEVNLGEKHACVYLFSQADPASSAQLRKTEGFTVKR